MGGKNSKPAVTYNQSSLPANVSAAYDALTKQAQTVAKTPYQAYTGQMVAPLTADQNAGFDTIRNLSGVINPYLQQAQQYTQQGAQAINPMAFSADAVNQYLSPWQDQVMSSAVANINATNAAQREGVTGDAIMKGAWGGDRSGVAQAELARSQNLANNQTLANLANQGYLQALSQFNTQQGVDLAAQQNNASRAGNAAFALGALGQQDLAANLQQAGAQLQAGSAQQAQQQNIDNALMQQWQAQQAYPFQTTGWLGNIVLGVGGATPPNTVQTSYGAQPSTAQTIGGLGATLLGGFLSSDERVKEDSEPVGKTFDGQTIYRYRYKGQPGFHMGLMAQEVEKREPDAVATGPGGFKMVNYEGATEGAAHRGHFACGGFAGSRPRFAIGGFAGNPYDYVSGDTPYASAPPVKTPDIGSTVGGFGPAVNRTLQFEGGLNPRDSNGAPSNFGINQKANPDVDVRSLTPDKARDIYRKRYWDAIGGDDLAASNPSLAHVAFDTAVIAGPGRAQQLLQQSGGDPLKYLDMREAFQKALLERDPQKYGPYAKAWSDRIAKLRSDVGGSADMPAEGATETGGSTGGGGFRDPSTGEPVGDGKQAGFSIGPWHYDPGPGGDMGRAIMAAGLGMLSSKAGNAWQALGEGGLKGLAFAQSQDKERREDADSAAQRDYRRQSLINDQRRIDLEAQRLRETADQARKQFELNQRATDSQIKLRDAQEQRDRQVYDQSQPGFREQQADKMGWDKTDPRVKEWIVTGKAPRTSDQMSVFEKKIIDHAAESIPQIDTTLDTLHRAKDLSAKIGSPLSTYWAGPKNMMGLANESDQAVIEYRDTMGMEAIKNMSATLKGATTDFELKHFEKILADPTTPKAQRDRVIDRMIRLSEWQREQNIARAKAVQDGTMFKSGGIDEMTKKRVAPADDTTVDAIPQQAIDLLRKGGGSDAQFDETFGPGAAAAVRKRFGGGPEKTAGGF